MSYQTADLFSATLEDEFQPHPDGIDLESPHYRYSVFTPPYSELNSPASVSKENLTSNDTGNGVPTTEFLNRLTSNNLTPLTSAVFTPPLPPLVNSKATLSEVTDSNQQLAPIDGVTVTPISSASSGIPIMMNGFNGPPASNVSVVPCGPLHVVEANGGLMLCGNNNSSIPVIQLGPIQLTQEDLNQVHQQLQAKIVSQAGQQQNTVLYSTPTSSMQTIPSSGFVIVSNYNSQPDNPQPIVSNNGVETISQQGFVCLPTTLPANPATVQTVMSNPQSIPAPKLQLGNSTSTQTATGYDDGDSSNANKPDAPPMTMHIMQSKDPELSDLEDLEKFAKKFKERRVELGFTQGDVGAALGRSAIHDFSQTTISRFEAMNLSLKNMIKLRPSLEKWLEHHEQRETCLTATTFGEPPISPGQNSRRRKRRTTIDINSRDLLENKFLIDKKPNMAGLQVIADQLNLERGVVRVWFCNRRQKEKRTQYYPCLNVQSASAVSGT